MATALPGEALVGTQYINQNFSGASSSLNVVTVPAGQYARVSLTHWSTNGAGSNGNVAHITGQGATQLINGTDYVAFAGTEASQFHREFTTDIVLGPGESIQMQKSVVATEKLNGFVLFFTEV